ncbi:MAG: TIGR03757 family integrating conjugative element protein [Exilibacterium sp.]
MEIIQRTPQYIACLLFLLMNISQIADADSQPLPNTMVVITSDNASLQQIEDIRRLLIQSGRGFSLHNLYAIQSLEHNLSKGLPNNETQAKAAFQQHLHKFGEAHFKSELVNAYQGFILASKFQIHRYPAIIFNNNAVIYGVTDLSFALKLYQDWQHRQAEKYFLIDGNR